MIKKIFLILSIVTVFFSCSFYTFAYSFEDSFNDYVNDYNEMLDEESIYSNSVQLYSAARVDPSDISTYPKGLTIEEFNAIYYAAHSPLYSDLIQTFKDDTVLNPHILYLRAIFEMPFVSNAKGGNCDSKFVWWDNYSQSYFIIEYNSSIVDIYYTDLNYNKEDSYNGYIWFKFYYPTNQEGKPQNELRNVFLTSMSNYLGMSYYGTNEKGYLVYPMYIYQLYEPTMYNSTNEISVVDLYGDVYAYTGSHSNTTRKVSNWWICGRVRFSTGYYNAPDVPNFIRPKSSFIAQGTIMYHNNNTFVESIYGNGQSYIEGSTGEYIGSWDWGDYNLRDDYINFSVPAAKFWLFGKMLGQTVSTVSSPYGIFSPIVVPMVDTLNYFVNYYLPNAQFEFSRALNDRIQTFNNLYNAFIAGETSTLFIFRFLISILYIAVVLRLLLSLSELRE